MPDQLVDVFDKGEQAPVPLLAGFNAGEIRSLRMLAPPVPASAAEYERTIHERYRDLADEFLKLYPSSNMQESIWATTRDALYGWTAERLVRKQTAMGEPSFLYFFDHGYPAADTAGLHAFHGSELPYVFGTLDRTPPLWPKIPATAVEAEALRCHGRLLEQLRAHGPAAGSGCAGLAAITDRQTLTWISPTRRIRRIISAGHVYAERRGRVPPPGQRRHRVELECRPRLAAAS